MSFSIKDLIKDFRSTREIAEGSVRLGLIVEGKEDIDPFIHELLEGSENPDVEIVDLLKDDEAIIMNLVKDADLLFFGFTQKSVNPERIYKIARQAQFQKSVYKVFIDIEKLDHLKEILSDIASATDSRVDDISAVSTLARINLEEFARDCVNLINEAKVIPLGRDYPFFRQAAALSTVSKTARQNGLVATVMFGGADFPILTANQIKMLLQIAAIYGEELDEKRIKELIAVIGGGYTFKSVARSLLGIVPGPQIFIKGAIGYAGTLAMGKAAIKYFEDERFKKVRQSAII